MRVAALYDIHGNLPPLEAVLRGVRDAGVDHIVVGGDVFPGPMAVEALSLLRGLDIPIQFIQGNGDRETLAIKAGKDTPAVPEAYRPAMRWGAERLSDDQGEVVFCHATPRNEVVNAGSVGMPFGHAAADWLLLGPGVELRHTSYDLVAAATRIRATRYPNAEEFAATYILNPPTEEEMLKAFAGILPAS